MELLIDKAPSQSSVLQLAELLLAECESASIDEEGVKRGRTCSFNLLWLTVVPPAT